MASLIACQLETGRTHQIRVHLAHIGHPLLGDNTYGGGFKTKAKQLPPEAQQVLATLDRQALHARALGFEHPVTREDLLFERAPPADFQQPAGGFAAGLTFRFAYFEASEIFRPASERQRPDR